MAKEETCYLNDAFILVKGTGALHIIISCTAFVTKHLISVPLWRHHSSFYRYCCFLVVLLHLVSKMDGGQPFSVRLFARLCTLTSGRECGKNKERFKGFEGRGADRRPHKSCKGKRRPFFTFDFDGTENVSGGQRSAKHIEALAKKEHTRKNV
jgi:hypothetical protein